jgi:deoxyribodipyrimidine photolyase-like uncharacterized protein
VEGFVRQLIGWRDYVWHLYWHLGPDYRQRNALRARTPLPGWFTSLDADAVQARCLKDALAQVREHGYAHHIIRLMVLGNYALQRGWDPAELTSWFHASFRARPAWPTSTRSSPRNPAAAASRPEILSSDVSDRGGGVRGRGERAPARSAPDDRR